MVSEHASPLAAIAGVDAGGQNRHVAGLAAGLVRRGHAVTVYTRRYAEDLPTKLTAPAGFDVVHVPVGPPIALPKDELLPYMRPFGRWMADRWLSGRRPDVVHAHFWMSGVAAVVAATHVRVPTVLTYHALGTVKRCHQQEADTSPVIRIAVERHLGLAVDRVIAQSADEVAEITALGVPVQKIALAASGVDIDRFAPWGPSMPRSRRSRVLSVGRMVERKGFDDLIYALRAVPEAELVIIGGPEDGLDDEPEAGRLLALARLLEVADRVQLIGAVPPEAMPAWYRSADLVACTPWYEPFGLTALEAMACGVPVVAYGVGGLGESVLDGVTGALVDPGDIVGLATTMADLLTDDAERERLGMAGRCRAVDRYDGDFSAARVARVYSEARLRLPTYAAST